MWGAGAQLYACLQPSGRDQAERLCECRVGCCSQFREAWEMEGGGAGTSTWQVGMKDIKS